MRPSAEMAGAKLSSSASDPKRLSEIRAVAPRSRSRTKTSECPVRSAGARLLASEANATNRPSAEIEGCTPSLVASTSAELTDTRSVVPSTRSLTNTSWRPLVSPGTRFVALDTNATKRPSADTALW